MSKQSNTYIALYEVPPTPAGARLEEIIFSEEKVIGQAHESNQ